MTENICCNCQWFETAWRVGQKNEKRFGQCRRFPPKKRWFWKMGVFTTVCKDDYCGEFKKQA